jgi:protoporphyrinogen oxidase
MKIAVLGGGLTGLTIGYLLNKKGIDCEILEKEERCGGLMRTTKEKGFTFDCYGSHIIFSKDREVLDYMLHILGTNKIKNRRNSKILYKTHYLKYPFENGLAGLPKEENFECLYYFVQNLISKKKGELEKPKNLKEWFYFTFGKGIAEKYLIPYNEKIWKHPTEKIGLDWVKRIPNPPIEDILKSSLGIETEGYTHQLNFYYPKIGGIQSLIKSLERGMKGITTEFEVTKIEKEDQEWTVSDGKEVKFYDRIISTIPIQDLVRAINSPVEVLNAADNLQYNSLISIMIGLKNDSKNNLTWLYIPDKNALPHRVGFPSNYSPYIVPAGKSSVLAEVTCQVGSEVWNMKDEEVVGQVLSDLDRLQIIDKSEVCLLKAKRTKYAYVINDLNCNENMRIVKNYVARIGIDLVGRFAEFKYFNMDDCVRRSIDFVNTEFLPEANCVH